MTRLKPGMSIKIVQIMQPSFLQQIAIKSKLMKHDNLEDIIEAAGEDLDLKSVKLNLVQRTVLVDQMVNLLMNNGVQLKEK